MAGFDRDSAPIDMFGADRGWAQNVWDMFGVGGIGLRGNFGERFRNIFEGSLKSSSSCVGGRKGCCCKCFLIWVRGEASRLNVLEKVRLCHLAFRFVRMLDHRNARIDRFHPPYRRDTDHGDIDHRDTDHHGDVYHPS